MEITDILPALDPLIPVFDELDIHYYIGGSLASSLYGIYRATADIDIVADMKQLHIDMLV